MQPLTQNDLWPLPVYEGVRKQFMGEVIAAKQHRRIAIGPFMSLVFENRLTVKLTVQELLRAERITNPATVEEELHGFNTMLPGAGELSATLLIELTGEDAAIKAQLAKLVGLKDHVALELDGRRVQGQLDKGWENARQVAAVQFVRFPVGKLDPERPAALVVDHPSYSHRAELSADVKRSLAADLEG